MATVTHTVLLPDGSAPTSVGVSIRLIATSGNGVGPAFVTATGAAVEGDSDFVVAAGTWSKTLTANSLITPAGTVWRVVERVGRLSYIWHANVTGNGDLSTMLVSPPASLPTAGSQIYTDAQLAAHVAAADPHPVYMTAAEVQAAAVGGDLTGTVANAQIAAGAVGTAELAASAVTTAKIADQTIAEADLAFDTRTTGDGSLRGSLPNFAGAVTDYNDVTAATITVASIGSSVGLGSTLTTPAVDAPGPYLTTKLAAKVNKLGNATIGHYQGCIAGHAFANAPADYTAAKGAAPATVRLVPIVFGMNDGTSDLYHGNQTLPGVRTFLTQLVAAIRADHADPLVFTSPHPHTGRETWTMVSPIIYPSGVQKPDSTTAQSIKTITTATGASVPCSYRHLRVNELIRRTCVELGVTCVDVEPYWFEAVATYGENALFNVGEAVHPNDLGHAQSYHLAIDHWVRGLDTGKVIATAPPTAQITYDEQFNVQTTSSLTIATVDKQYGLLRVRARHPAFPTHHHGMWLVIGDEASACRVQLVSEIQAAGPTSLVTVATSGANVTITPTINGTDLAWTLTNGYPLP